MEDTMANVILTELREFRAENNKRWEENSKCFEQNDIIVALETMQKSISNQFTEKKEYMDEKFEKIFALQRVNDTEHDEFKKLLYTYNKRLDFHNARISNLEEWKQQLDMGEYTAV